MPPRPITSPQALSLLCLLQCLGLSSLSPPTLPDSLCTSLPASLHRSLSLTHTSPSQAHCYLLLLLLIVLLLIITPSLTASLSTLLRSTCIFRSHLPLLLSTSPAADDNPAERLRRCSPLISIHPVRRRTHARTHARTRLRTAPHVHTHFDLVTITPATGHRLHRSSHPRYTTRRRERLPFCAASSTTLASRTRRPIDVRTRQQRTSRTHFIFRRQSTTKTLHCRGSWHWHLERTLFLCNLIICTSQQPRGL